jgi:hypothetical protein
MAVDRRPDDYGDSTAVIPTIHPPATSNQIEGRDVDDRVADEEAFVAGAFNP